MTRKRGVGQKREGTKGKKPRLQIWKGRRMAQYLPAILPIQVEELLGSPVSLGARERERDLAERDEWGWREAIYLGFAQVLPGPLELQPEVGGVRAALEGVEFDPKDALHLEPLPLHAGLGFGRHHDPFLRWGVAPGQEHGCPACP